ncbi:c-type cytochrome [Salipiger abyssi]|uniref:c-type cytochrome n=1 Tax=Salipiger abyssi TaxID=1250539 RepID=UPI00360F782A
MKNQPPLRERVSPRARAICPGWRSFAFEVSGSTHIQNRAGAARAEWFVGGSRSAGLARRPAIWVGTMLLVLSSGLVVLPARAQTADGERLFQQRCASCHSLDEGGRGAGPSLSGVFGRPAGSVEGARYSRALEESNLVWDAPTLDAFLENPRGTVPGTVMAVRVTDPAQREAIIDLLRDHETAEKSE